MIMISKEAEEVLLELVEHESDGSYWVKKFTSVDHRTRTILSGCFKELEENKLISAIWADSVPIHTEIQKDGYLYQQRKEDNDKTERNKAMKIQENTLQYWGMFGFKLGRMEWIWPRNTPETVQEFDKALRDLQFMLQGEISPSQESYEEYSSQILQFFLKKDLEIYSCILIGIGIQRYQCGLVANGEASDVIIELAKSAINGIPSSIVPNRELLFSIIQSNQGESISEIFTEIAITLNNAAVKDVKQEVSKNNIFEYDVFISHANKDKEDLIEELYQSLSKLGISIFYDKESLEWGDNWKERILNGTMKAEFAIIVISENFFDREWTERELSEFLNRQNRNGQKLILPIIHNITTEQLKAKYPNVADIQAIDSKKYNCDQIALLFARQLIKRLKTE